MRNSYLPLAFLATLFLFSSATLLTQEFGIASYYADDFQGRATASGEKYDKSKLTAAHKTLPFGTILQVTRLDTKQSVKVRVNDRGPYITGRIVDLSRKAAEVLDLIEDGQTEVKIEVVSKADFKETATTTTKKPEVKTTTPVVTKPKEYTEKSVELPNDKRATLEKVVKKAEKPNATVVKTPVVKKTTETTTATPIVAKTTQKAAEAEYKMVQRDYQQYDLYKIQLLRPEKNGYGVQVASLTQYENVLKKIAELQGEWFKNILISVEKGDSKPVYKIILGPFPDFDTANAYKKSLKTKNKITGFVVDLSDIQY